MKPFLFFCASRYEALIFLRSAAICVAQYLIYVTQHPNPTKMLTLYLSRFFAVMGLMLVCQSSLAQQRSKDITVSAGYGVLPVPILFYHMASNGGSGGDFVESSSGSNFASARYSITDRFSVGLSYGYLHYTNYSISNYGNTRKRTGNTIHTIAIGCNRTWKNGKHFRLYSLFDAGIAYSRRSTKPNVYKVINMQFFPFGISVGGRFSGNIEFGLGYKGLICGGISYCFQRKTETQGSHCAQ